ncbi:UNVERIFIED_CONTAM: hypothetical protein Sindi_2959600 [Sesamum indicum]
MCKCRSHGTFPLFGLQSSHLNICYYHQDPHRRPLRPGSRPGFCGDRRALLLIGAWPLPRRPGIGRALQRHPFSGLVDSGSAQLGHRNPASGSSRIASSAYQNGPLGALDSLARLNGAAAPTRRSSSSYPEGNFGGNQLLDGSISPFAPIPKSDERFARQYRCGPPPEFPLASPRSGIVHHLSGPDRYAHSNPSQKIKVGRRLAPLGGDRAGQLPYALRVCSPLTRTHVRLLGPCFKTGRMGSPLASAGSAQLPRHAVGARCPPRSGRRRSAGISTARALAAASIRAGPRPEPIGGPALAVPHPTGAHRRPPSASLPTISSTLLTLFSKSFSSFPRRYLFAIGLSPVFSLGRNLPPDWGCIPKQPDSPTAPRGAGRVRARRGSHPLRRPFPGDLGPVRR